MIFVQRIIIPDCAIQAIYYFVMPKYDVY